jgi:hypothetical protein
MDQVKYLTVMFLRIKDQSEVLLKKDQLEVAN